MTADPPNAPILHETREARKKRETIVRRDLKVLAMLPLWFALSWALPQRSWPAASRMLGATRSRLAHRIGGARTEPPLDAEATAAELERNRVEHSFQYCREYRPGGWIFPSSIEGLEHIARARQERRGVVLWMAHFVFHGLAAKKLLFEHGIRVHHVSRPEHGYSKTAFGIRFLNPVRRRIEDRYLASRVLIGQRSREDLAAHLRDLLRNGEIISITAGAWEGRRIARVPFFGGRYPLATGAPFLAHAHGAALVPVFCWRGAAGNGGLNLKVDRPIELPAEAGRAEVVDHALNEFMLRHEAIVGAAPGEWRGWNYFETVPPSENRASSAAAAERLSGSREAHVKR